MFKRLANAAIPFAFVGMLFGLSVSVASADDSSNQAVQQELNARMEKFFADQKPFPYGTYQYTDRSLLLAISKDPSKYALIDIRTPTYHDFFCGVHSNKHVCVGRGWQRIYGYAQGHVPGAQNIPYLNLPAAIKGNTIPKNKTVIVMCPTGQLSNQTAGVLRMLGYDAYALRGGVNGWKKAGYPIVIGKEPGTMAQACHPWQTCWRQFQYDNPQAH